MTRFSLEDLKFRFGLSYHLDYLQLAEDAIGLRGKRVLEVGGGLPKELVIDIFGAAQWIGIEEAGYWQEKQAGEASDVAQNQTAADLPIRQATPDALGTHAVLGGSVENLPDALAGHFDVVFSIAAFEHINRFPEALDRMHAALRQGGKLFSRFAPIWSSHHGHHIPVITDQSGKRFTFSQSPIPPWGHILMREGQLYQHLLQHTDQKTASEIIYYVYHSPQINRLFTEDYLDYFTASPFKTLLLEGVYNVEDTPISQKLLNELRKIYPTRTFSNYGIYALLEKP